MLLNKTEQIGLLYLLYYSVQIAKCFLDELNYINKSITENVF